MSVCIALTRQNKGCKLKCTDAHVYCNTHMEVCQKFLKKYHKPCNKTWFRSCNENMTIKDIYLLIDDLEKCYRLRCKFGQTCCQGKGDKGHIGAMVKIQEKIEGCLKVLNRIELRRRLFGKK